VSSAARIVVLSLLVCSCASTVGEPNVQAPEPPPGPLEPDHQGEFVRSGNETSPAPARPANDAGALADAGAE
jgi:hypothetical protein